MLLAAGRVAFGLAFLMAPRKAAHAWIGDDVDRKPVELLVRAVGARDVVLGAGGMLAVATGQPVRPWLRAGVGADAADALTTGLYLRHLPLQGALATLALTAGATYAGVRVAARVD